VVYVSLRRSVRLIRTMTLVVRGRGDVTSLVATIRNAVHEIDPQLPLYNVQTLQEIVDQQSGDVLRLVLGEGATLAGLGVAIGILGALLATTLIRSWLFEVGHADPATFGAVAGGLVVVALLASYVPARRAASVDPLLAMRGGLRAVRHPVPVERRVGQEARDFAWAIGVAKRRG
jgi:hypothetical protein